MDTEIVSKLVKASTTIALRVLTQLAEHEFFSIQDRKATGNGMARKS